VSVAGLGDAATRWAARALGADGRVVAARPLAGGGLHAVHALDVRAGGELHRVVLRRWARPGWEATDAEFDARREIAVLDLLPGRIVRGCGPGPSPPSRGRLRPAARASSIATSTPATRCGWKAG
jgi:hypothetical protein